MLDTLQKRTQCKVLQISTTTCQYQHGNYIKKVCVDVTNVIAIAIHFYILKQSKQAHHPWLISIAVRDSQIVSETVKN